MHNPQSNSKEQGSHCRPAPPKWAALIEDKLFPMPRQTLSARDILDQAGIGPDFVLIRDHSTQNDRSIADQELVDLAKGNVFRVIPECEGKLVPMCDDPPKLAFACDDNWKVTLAAAQTEHSLKRLFGVSEDSEILRDYESPSDQPIKPGDPVHFADGPVFRARRCLNSAPSTPITIIVNGREKLVHKVTITYGEVVELAFGKVDENSICTVTYKNGTPDQPEGRMVKGDEVKIKCGEIFNVARTQKS
jgi:hypothetical protein